MKKYCSVHLSWNTRRSPSIVLCFNTAISNSTRSTEKNTFYGRKPTHIHQSPQSPPDGAKEAKEQWLEEKCQEIERKKDQNPNEMFKRIREITGKMVSRPSACIKSSTGEILYEPEDVARRWSEYLGQLFNDFRTNEVFTHYSMLSPVHQSPITKSYGHFTSQKQTKLQDQMRWPPRCSKH